MKNFDGLKGIKENGYAISCKCGNGLSVVNNGFMAGELLFCDKCEKIYNIGIKEVTKMADEQFIKQCRNKILLEKTRYKINLTNIDKVMSVLEK